MEQKYKQGARKKLIAAVVVGGLAFGVAAPAVAFTLSSVSASDAEAASIGVGWRPLKNYVLADGTFAYCIQLAHNDPTGSQLASNIATAIETDAGPVSGASLGKMNYIIWKYGQTSDPLQGAAVAAAVHYFGGEIDIEGNISPAVLAQPTAAFESPNVFVTYIDPAPAALKPLFQQFVAEAEANYVASPSAPSSPMFIAEAQVDAYQGVVRVPSGYTELVLVNGVWDATGTNTLNPEGAAGDYAWTGTPPNDQKTYQVNVVGKYSINVPGQGNEVTVHGKTQSGDQNIITSTNRTLSGTKMAVFSDPLFTQFQPVLTSQVPVKNVKVGETFSDTVTFDIAEGSERWRQKLDGSYYPVVAKGTLYGPMFDKPVPGEPIPAGAPVASQTTVTTSTTQGPGTYEVSWPDFVSEESGFYQAVWEVRAQDNPDLARYMLIDPDYYFMDEWGIESEQQITDMQVKLTSQISTEEVFRGEHFTDSLTISGVENGQWLTDNGVRIPIRVKGTVYQTTTQPEPQPTAPVGEDVEVLQELTGVFYGPNRSFETDPIKSPEEPGTWVTIQWCVDQEAMAADGHANTVEDHCDTWGVPNETLLVSEPAVVTTAQTDIEFGEEAWDTAKVTGALPTELEANEEVVVSFQAFKKVDVNEELSYENVEMVYDGSDVLIPVEETGLYKSQPVEFEENVDHFWVETLAVVNTETGESEVLHVGELGAAGETTRFALPKTADVINTGGDLDGWVTGVGIASGAAALIAASLLLVRRRKVGSQ